MNNSNSPDKSVANIHSTPSKNNQIAKMIEISDDKEALEKYIFFYFCIIIKYFLFIIIKL